MWLEKLRFQVSGKTSILKKVFESRSGQNHSKRCVKLQFWMTWGKWRKSFFVAGAAHRRLEGWKQWFHCTGAGFRESETFASQLFWDLQFQSGVFEVLNRAVPLGFAMQSVCSEVRFCEKSRVKRSFWKLGLSLLVKVSCKMLVLEAWLVTFGESLVENARFGSLACHFWWKSRGKCSFWKLGFSLLVKVSCKMLVLEAWLVTFGESLVENARFGSLACHFWWQSRGKCSFWKLGLSLLVKVSWNLEASLVVSTKSVLTRVSSRSVKKECLARVSSKSV